MSVYARQDIERIKFRLLSMSCLSPARDYRSRMSIGTKSVKAFISKAEVARRRGLSRVSVYSLIARGHLPVDEAGRIPRADFEALQARLASETAGDAP